MLLGDDERVAGAHGVDIQEGQEAVVFVDDVRGDFVTGDAAEQAVVGHACLGVKRDGAAAARPAAPGGWPQYR